MRKRVKDEEQNGEKKRMEMEGKGRIKQVEGEVEEQTVRAQGARQPAR